MKRDLSPLYAKKFDLLIVGSGIYGAFLAREAGLRGLSVALIDSGDFGSATSANSLKVVHGGLRYLQHLNLVRMRESIRARRQLLHIAPYLIKPKSFTVPTYGWGLQSKWVMRAALLLNDLISFDRNKGLQANQRIPMGKTLSRSQCLQRMPFVNKDKLTGAAVWHDGFIEDTERLMMAIIHSTAKQGSCVANYVSAERYLIEDNCVQGVEACDRLNHESFDIKAHFVINAAGPGATLLDKSLEVETSKPVLSWVKAFNVFSTKKLADDSAYGLSSETQTDDDDSVLQRGKRLYFFVPWKGGTLIGTDYVKAIRPDYGQPATAGLNDEELASIINEINTLHPEAELTRQDVAYCHAGYLPASRDGDSADAASRLLKHTTIVDHKIISAIDAVFTVSGIKYTVAPQAVIDVIDAVAKKLQVSADRPKNEPVLYGAEKASFSTDKLTGRYGSHATDVLSLAENAPDYLQTVSKETETLVAEVIYAVREEMAVKLIDVVFRRTGLASRGTPDRGTIERCAEIMAKESDWNAERKQQEIDEVESYRVLRKG